MFLSCLRSDRSAPKESRSSVSGLLTTDPTHMYHIMSLQPCEGTFPIEEGRLEAPMRRQGPETGGPYVEERPIQRTVRYTSHEE